MKLEFNRGQLLELMRDFHTLSGIRIVLFDDEYHELLSYPEQPCKFCSLLKSNPETKGLCDASDARSFREAEAKKKLILVCDCEYWSRQSNELIGKLLQIARPI